MLLFQSGLGFPLRETRLKRLTFHFDHNATITALLGAASSGRTNIVLALHLSLHFREFKSDGGCDLPLKISATSS
jgi:hypothetical protein